MINQTQLNQMNNLLGIKMHYENLISSNTYKMLEATAPMIHANENLSSIKDAVIGLSGISEAASSMRLAIESSSIANALNFQSEIGRQLASISGLMAVNSESMNQIKKIYSANLNLNAAIGAQTKYANLFMSSEISGMISNLNSIIPNLNHLSNVATLNSEIAENMARIGSLDLSDNTNVFYDNKVRTIIEKNLETLESVSPEVVENELENQDSFYNRTLKYLNEKKFISPKNLEKFVCTTELAFQVSPMYFQIDPVFVIHIYLMLCILKFILIDAAYAKE